MKPSYCFDLFNLLQINISRLGLTVMYDFLAKYNPDAFYVLFASISTLYYGSLCSAHKSPIS